MVGARDKKKKGLVVCLKQFSPRDRQPIPKTRHKGRGLEKEVEPKKGSEAIQKVRGKLFVMLLQFAVGEGEGRGRGTEEVLE